MATDENSKKAAALKVLEPWTEGEWVKVNDDEVAMIVDVGLADDFIPSMTLRFEKLEAVDVRAGERRHDDMEIVFEGGSWADVVTGKTITFKEFDPNWSSEEDDEW